MKFIEALKSVIATPGNAMRRPEMAGYVKASGVSRSLSVSVNGTTFGSQVSQVSGTYKFEYSGSSWVRGGTSVNMATYGITVTGTPVYGDSVSVTYKRTSASASVRSSTSGLYPSVNASTFGSSVSGTGGTYTFSYSGGVWKRNGSTVSLQDYGITIARAASAGDSIVVSYVSPSDFASSEVSSSGMVSLSFYRWNLEDQDSHVQEATFVLTTGGSGGSSVVKVEGPTIVPVSGHTVTSFQIGSYLMTAILADDWFVTTSAKSEEALTGGTHW